jgi:ribosomal protein S18 acetylase RimI-like enzyme
MEIRRLEIDELGIVTDLAHHIWPPTFKDILTTQQLEYMLNWMYSKETLEDQFVQGNQFYLMEKGSSPVGFMGIELHYPEKHQVKIHKLYVLPETQGSGAGRKFIEKAKEVALENGLRELVLNVNRFNKAVDFYHKMGFKIEKEEDIAIGQGFLMEDYVMSLSLKH